MAEPGTPPPAFPPHIEDTIRSIAQLNVEHKENASRPQLWIDRVTGFLGQPRFIGAASLVIVCWNGAHSSRKKMQLNRDWRQIAVAHFGGNPEGGTEEVSAGPSISSYALEAGRLDQNGKTYWTQGKEMAARAFQSYVEDRLAQRDRRNDYLSTMADNKYYDCKPYPEGEERVRINAAFDKLFDALRASGGLAKAMGLLLD